MTTDLRTAAQQALEAIYGAKLCEFNSMSSRSEMIRLMNAAITILEAALAEPVCCCGEPTAAGVVHRRDGPCYMAEPVQEPYAWMAVGGSIWRHKTSEDDVPLYTAPPQSKPLTEEDKMNLREAAEQALEAYDKHEPLAVVMEDLRVALAEPVHKPDCALLQIPSRDCNCGADPLQPLADAELSLGLDYTEVKP